MIDFNFQPVGNGYRVTAIAFDKSFSNAGVDPRVIKRSGEAVLIKNIKSRLVSYARQRRYFFRSQRSDRFQERIQAAERVLEVMEYQNAKSVVHFCNFLKSIEKELFTLLPSPKSIRYKSHSKMVLDVIDFTNRVLRQNSQAS